MLRQPDSHIFILNFTDALTVLNGLPTRNVIVDTHDLKAIKFAKINKLAPFSISVLARLRAEMAVLRKADSVIAISPEEIAVYRTVMGIKCCYFIPTFKSQPVDYVENSLGDIKKYDYDLLFVGSDYYFNSVGIVDFLKKNCEWLEPYKIAIAGNVCRDKNLINIVAERSCNSIYLLGFVDDLRSLYKSSKIVLSPVDLRNPLIFVGLISVKFARQIMRIVTDIP